MVSFRRALLTSGVVLLSSGCAAVQQELATAAQAVREAGAEASAGTSRPPVGAVDEATAKASGVPVNSVVQGTLTRLGEVDDYPFRGTEGQEVFVYFQGAGGYHLLSHTLELRNTTNTSVLSSENSRGNQERLEDKYTDLVRLRETGTYTVRVQGHDKDHPQSRGPYRFKVVAINSAPEKLASAFTIGDIVAGEAIDPHFDRDEFTFAGRRGQRLVGNLQGLNQHHLLSHTMEILGPSSARPLAEVSSRGNAEYLNTHHTDEFVLPETGTYRVRVRGHARTDIGPYRFQIREVR
jgi:hypothetical protein